MIMDNVEYERNLNSADQEAVNEYLLGLFELHIERRANRGPKSSMVSQRRLAVRKIGVRAKPGLEGYSQLGALFCS